MKVPKFTIDPVALRKGWWGNTWKNWGYILLAFTGLYLIEAGYFTGMLFASEEIRGTDYRTLTQRYFGKFDRASIPTPFPYPGVQNLEPFNRPEGCVTEEEDITLEGTDIVVAQASTGVQVCSGNKDNTNWVIFPWVKNTLGLEQFPGCSVGTTVLTPETSPAYVGTVADPAPSSDVACQNFVFVTPSEGGPAAAAAPGPSAG